MQRILFRAETLPSVTHPSKFWLKSPESERVYTYSPLIQILSQDTSFLHSIPLLIVSFSYYSIFFYYHKVSKSLL